jgi:hypothetical protein
MENDTDKKFVRGLFALIAFGLTTGVIGYGLYTQDWSLIIGVLCGGLGAAIAIALKK